jgi:hypothetical protein
MEPRKIPPAKPTEQKETYPCKEESNQRWGGQQHATITGEKGSLYVMVEIVTVTGEKTKQRRIIIY